MIHYLYTKFKPQLIILTVRDGCEGPHDNHEQMEHICGRPLGLCFNQSNGDMYIADAYMGLLSVGPEGGLASQIATSAQGVPFGFTNSLEIDHSTASVYFTDSSSLYTRRYVKPQLFF